MSAVLDDDTEKAEPGSLAELIQRRTTAHNKFMYGLYRHLSDPTGGHKDKVIVFASEREDAVARVDSRQPEGLFRQEVTKIIPLLITDDEVAWIRLLLWVGRFDHMFGLFKAISPFAGKSINCRIKDLSGYYSFLEGKDDGDSYLPSIPHLWPRCQEQISQISNKRIVVLALRENTISMFMLKD